MGQLCESFKLDPITFGPASTSGVNTAVFYGRGRYSNGPGRSISSSPTIGESGRLSSTSSPLLSGHSATPRMSIYTRPAPVVDVDRRIAATLNELAKVDSSIVQNGSADASGAFNSRSRNGSQNFFGISNESAQEEFSILRDIPLEDFARTVEEKLNIAKDESMRPTDLVDGGSFTSSNLSSSTPLNQMSPARSRKAEHDTSQNETVLVANGRFVYKSEFAIIYPSYLYKHFLKFFTM